MRWKLRELRLEGWTLRIISCRRLCSLEGGLLRVELLSKLGLLFEKHGVGGFCDRFWKAA